MTNLEHSCVERDKVIKDNQFFKSLPEDLLPIRITDNNKVSFLNNYSLVATINHSGNLNNRHYWAIIKDVATNQWFSCNDKVVFKIKAADLKTSYVLFFVKKYFFFPLMLLLCKGDFSIQTLSLGVTMPNLIPVQYGY